MPTERRFGRKLLIRLSLVLSFVFVLSLSQDAASKPFRISKLPEGGRIFKCSACHADPRGGQPLTAFGNDWQEIAMKAGDKYTEELGKMDSDGDGFTNDQEFEAKSNPGDVHSKPAE